MALGSCDQWVYAPYTRNCRAYDVGRGGHLDMPAWHAARAFLKYLCFFISKEIRNVSS